MSTMKRSFIWKKRGTWVLAIVPLLLLGFQADARAFELNVVNPDGAPVAGFRWLLEEDTTHDPQPGVHMPVYPGSPELNTLAISNHRSHAPVVANGESATSSATIDLLSDGATALPPGRYVVSVLPYFRGGTPSAYTMGGGNINTATTGSITVVVTPNPIQTAQIAIKVFHDIEPVNNAPDVTEPGLPGFGVKLFDMAGELSQNAFGHAPGTGYQKNPDGSFVLDCGDDFMTHGGGENPCIDPASSIPLLTDANGEITVKYLSPGKYGIQVVPPSGEGWYQTTTIEGTKTIDAWVRPNEPPFLVEFGPPFWHAFYGFVQEMDRLDEIAPPGPRTTVLGQVRKGHTSRPPGITFFDGAPPSTSACIIGLNSLETAVGEAVWVRQCADEGFFEIPNVPPGTYQLVIWDKFLDHIISFNTVITPETGGVMDLGTIATPMWFGEQEHYVFNDLNENGVWEMDSGEEGLFDVGVNLRFRDGTIYKAFPTDLTGFVPFEEVFPFFHWQVAEVAFGRLKPTGLTVVVDDGGQPTDDAFGEGKRTPQAQAPEADDVNVSADSRYRTELGPVLLEAFQVFAGQNLRFEWGQTPFTEAENGGIAGSVYYATTRAENDPRYQALEPWEPGIPRVQINLYKDNLSNETGLPAFDSDGNPGDGIADPKDPAATFPYLTPVYADVDNHPLGWSEDGAKGPEDIDHNSDGVFDLGDAVSFTRSDSWDDNLPSGCRGNAEPVTVHGTAVPIADCAEGLRTWNQVRPGVFDGGWAFGYSAGEGPMETGGYIVEVGLPPGYKHLKEEDRNVDFGETPVPAILPPACVGEMRTVPPYFSFLTVGGDGTTLFPGIDPADAAAPFASESRPLCDKRKLVVKPAGTALIDIGLFTDVPKAARAVGLITDDFANELAPGKPAFTEKFSPGWMPIAWFDYSDKEIIRSYGDEFGAYNILTPSTYNVNLPIPAGIGPQMHRLCLNHPGPIPNPDFTPGSGLPEFITDPYFKTQYSTTCYSFNYETARTTYLDTPVIRVAAFVGALQSTLDCELPDGTPVLSQFVDGPLISGAANSTFTFRSAGTVDVPNPQYPGTALDGSPADPPLYAQFISRDFSFGAAEGTVMVGGYTLPAGVVAWANDAITVTVTNGPVRNNLLANSGGELTVIRTNGRRTLTGLTLTVGDPGGMVLRVGPAGRPFTKIQDAVDQAANGDLILVDPGIYNENVIVYKRVRIQGSGAWSTIINAIHYPGDALQAWREKLAFLADPACTLPADGLPCIGLLPGQTDVDPLFVGQEGPGFFVIPPEGRFATGGQSARIDGFTVRGADLGGGIFVNAYANNLQILNNRLINNNGTFGGGVRVGSPEVTLAAGAQQVLDPSPNPNVRISYNHILSNGSLNYGGGVALFAGADAYNVSFNSICGNLARWGGGGISHLGLSDGGMIERNDILFNEVFQGNEIGGGGGGIEVAGEPDLAGGLTEGAGDVTVQRNLVQGNLGGAADGGGIALRFVNGQDVEVNPTQMNMWYAVDINRNIIVNNVTGLGGAAISLQDAARASIDRNTMANNDGAAVAAAAFLAGPTDPTTPQPAGIVSRPHSAALAAVTGPGISVPAALSRNIVWHSRTFYFDAAATPNLQPTPAPLGPYWDLSAGLVCSPNCVLSGGPTPTFVSPYVNDLFTAAAADEGGNFVQLLFTPLGRTGNYTGTSGPAGASGPVGTP